MLSNNSDSYHREICKLWLFPLINIGAFFPVGLVLCFLKINGRVSFKSLATSMITVSDTPNRFRESAKVYQFVKLREEAPPMVYFPDNCPKALLDTAETIAQRKNTQVFAFNPIVYSLKKSQDNPWNWGMEVRRLLFLQVELKMTMIRKSLPRVVGRMRP